VRRVAVVGGGLAGLVAARDLAAAGDSVVVLEAGPVAGGKLRRAEVAGVGVDVGAEAMLARRPEGVDLARSLGLEVVHPAVQQSGVWVGGSVRPLPRTLMGAPLDVEELARSGVLSEDGLARARRESSLPPEPYEDDVSVGDLVARRFGDEVTDRLVEPLLGGVYAGRAREISARAAVPDLVAMAERGSVLDQAASVPRSDAPVFAGIPGGLGAMGEALVAGSTFELRIASTVRVLTRVERDSGPGFRLEVGPVPAPELVEVDAVVLATPAAATSRLLSGVAPVAAAELARLEYASMAIVTLAFRAADVDTLTGSGFLVPPVEGRTIKASTYSFAKWAWVREAGRGALGGEDVLLLRTSLGRHREEAVLQRADEELVAMSLTDLAAAAGVSAAPVDAHVQRWGGALPQYALGHLDRVVRIRGSVREVPGLAVCGAAYDGVGIPAVIASAHRAAREL
jgi:oxygen-dependent protoporphyrinogen oxidase